MLLIQALGDSCMNQAPSSFCQGFRMLAYREAEKLWVEKVLIAISAMWLLD